MATEKKFGLFIGSQGQQGQNWTEIKQKCEENKITYFDCSLGEQDIGLEVLTFPSMLTFCLDLCRQFQLLKNDKTLLVSTKDVIEKLHLLLSIHNKEKYESDDVEVSEVLDALRSIKSCKLNGETLDDKIGKEYKAYLKANNLVDVFDIICKIKESMQDNEEVKAFIKSIVSVAIQPQNLSSKSVENELMKVIFPEMNKVIESEITDEEEDGSKTEKYCMQLINGYFRLLVNSRDEMALASIIGGPSGILDHKAFTLIKREVNKTNMPMYQTIVSYVQKLKLGGKSYAPSSDHPFHPYNKELQEFIDFMEKLQDKIEDGKCESETIRKIFNLIKCQIVKSAKLRTSSVETAVDKLVCLLNELMESERLHSSSTPKRPVGCGGSVAGRKNLKVIRKVVDVLACRNCDGSDLDNIPALLGKLTIVTGTPVAAPKVSALFKSPDFEDESNISEIVEKSQILNETGKPSKVKNGIPRFNSALTWAPETSPLVLDDESDSPIVVNGPTLVAAEKRKETHVDKLVREIDDEMEGTPFKKIRLEAEKVIEESKALKKNQPKSKALPKRSILKDIANMKKPDILCNDKSDISMPKIDTKSDNIFKDKANISMPSSVVAQQLVEAINSKENDGSKMKIKEPLRTKKDIKINKTKKTSAKNQPLKGQMKMTAFLRM